MNNTATIKGTKGLSSFTLHILAMLFMLCDHMWGTIAGDQRWLTCVGRIAFPIFAFMIAEGFLRTSNVKKYLLRLFIFAIVSEIPFNLMMGGNVKGLGHQNVLWTFIIAILLILLCESIKRGLGKLFKMPEEVVEKKDVLELLVAVCKEKRLIPGILFFGLTILAYIIVTFAGFIIGTFSLVDYFGPGVVTVLVFYFFHKRNILTLIIQVLLIGYINVEMLAGMVYLVHPFGMELEIPEQGLALLALIPIWLYFGRQGYHKKWFRYFCYGFYPVHMLILFLLRLALA